MRNNAAYLPENPIVYIILPKSIRIWASFAIFVEYRIRFGRVKSEMKFPFAFALAFHYFCEITKCKRNSPRLTDWRVFRANASFGGKRRLCRHIYEAWRTARRTTAEKRKHERCTRLRRILHDSPKPICDSRHDQQLYMHEGSTETKNIYPVDSGSF